MRKFIVVLAFLAVALWALPASATVVLQVGENVAQIVDASSHYIAKPGGGPSDIPGAVGVAPLAGDELRAAIRVNNLAIGSNSPYWLNNSTLPKEELTGLFYDLVYTRSTFDLSGRPTFYYRPETLAISNTKTPNPLSADGAGPNIFASGIPFGGVIEIYDDSTPDMQGSPGAAGPAAWLTAGLIGGANHAVAPDSLLNATDGTLWLSGVFLDLLTMGELDAVAGEVYKLTFDQISVTGGTAKGKAYINVVGGSVASYVAFGALNPPNNPWCDATLETTVKIPDVNTPGWQASSHDPARILVIPEPTIMALFGASVLGGFIRRRRSL